MNEKDALIRTGQFESIPVEQEVHVKSFMLGKSEFAFPTTESPPMRHKFKREFILRMMLEISYKQTRPRSEIIKEMISFLESIGILNKGNMEDE